MSPFYRPTSAFSAPSGGGDLSPGTGTRELTGAGFSAGVESQLNQPVDANQAHAFYQAAHAEVSAMYSHVVAAPPVDASAAAALVPGANEPISPLIQLIMRMPGQLGLMSSFFEAIGNFILPHVHNLGFLDPSILAQHADAAMHATNVPLGEHMAVDPSLLPHDAPIFESLGHGLSNGAAGVDGLHGAAGGIEHAPTVSEWLGSTRNPLEVSGSVDLSKAQFEGAPAQMQQGTPTELLSGPSITEGNPASHLAGNQRLFSDGHLASFGSNLSHSAAPVAQNATAPVANNLSQSLPLSTTPQNFNVSASALGQGGEAALPAVPQAQEAVSQGAASAPAMEAAQSAPESTASSLGPSGAVGESGTRNLLAMNHADSFKATTGGMDAASHTGYDYGANYLQQQTPASSPFSTTSTSQAHTAANSFAKDVAAHGGLKGMKAQALSLDGASHSNVAHSAAKPSLSSVSHHAGHSLAKSHHSVMDQISHRHLSKVNYAPHHEAQAAPSQDAESAPSPEQANSSQVAETAQATDATQATDGGQATDAGLEPKSYTIRAGDCLWNIARDHLGEATRWEEIYKMNQDLLGTNPDLIQPGTTIQLPGGAHEIAEAGKYIVQPGDNLWNISRDHLGGGQNWGEIYHANEGIIGSNPNLIHPGQELNIPGEQASQGLASATPDAASQGVASATTNTANGVSQAATTSSSEAMAAAQPIDGTAAGAQPVVPASQEITAPASGAANAASPNLSMVPPAPPQAAPVLPPDTGHLSGPGAAEAASVPMQETAPQTSIVSPSMAPDLSQFFKKR